MKLPGPVQVEVYPDHEDFAVRTLGMPGLGALGVTFGEVVAMDSPSGRKPGDFNWASTLWHEMSHVYHPHRDQSSRAALVHRRPRRARRDAGVARVGRPHHARHPGRHPRQEAAAGRGSRSRLRPSRISSAGDRLLLTRRAASATTSRTAGARTSCSRWCIPSPSRNHARGDSGGSRHVARGVRQAVPGVARQADVGKTAANFDQVARSA